eukprot:760366-Prymnesium_polylepis.1
MHIAQETHGPGGIEVYAAQGQAVYTMLSRTTTSRGDAWSHALLCVEHYAAHASAHRGKGLRRWLWSRRDV